MTAAAPNPAAWVGAALADEGLLVVAVFEPEALEPGLVVFVPPAVVVGVGAPVVGVVRVGALVVGVVAVGVEPPEVFPAVVGPDEVTGFWPTQLVSVPALILNGAD